MIQLELHALLSQEPWQIWRSHGMVAPTGIIHPEADAGGGEGRQALMIHKGLQLPLLYPRWRQTAILHLLLR